MSEMLGDMVMTARIRWALQVLYYAEGREMLAARYNDALARIELVEDPCDRAELKRRAEVIKDYKISCLLEEG